MTFREVIHSVSHSGDWPGPVRGIASLLLPPLQERPCGQECPASSAPLDAHAVPIPDSKSYNATDFQYLIHSTAAELNALAELPHYGGSRLTIPLWSQLLRALANTLSPDVLVLEDTPFVMPRARDRTNQPSNLIDGHATLIAAYFICSAQKIRTDRSSTNTGIVTDKAALVYSTDSDCCSSSVVDEDDSVVDEDGLVYSTDPDSSDGSADSFDGLDLPLQAHMFPGRGKWYHAVLPVLLVADARNIVPLVCSALYQRCVWGVREPVVGLCCSNTGKTATAVFGWFDPDQLDECCMPVAHIALAASHLLDPLMGVFDFTDPSSAISLAQFVLRLRGHFEDIKRITSIESVNSLAPCRWRSDIPDFKTQIDAQLEDRVASWTHQVHAQTGSGETSSSSAPPKSLPLSDPIVSLSASSHDLHTIYEEGKSRAKILAPRSTRTTSKTRLSSVSQLPSSKGAPRSQSLSSQSYQPALEAEEQHPSWYPKSSSAGVSDADLGNWLIERSAFTVGRIAIPSKRLLAEDSGIHEMIEIYDQITDFTWSDAVESELLVSEIDAVVLGVRNNLFEKYASGNYQSVIQMPMKDVEFISTRFSALLHAVRGARDHEGIATDSTNAECRHEWDALLLTFFRPVAGQRDVLLEQKLNFARNPAVGDASFRERVRLLTQNYHDLCLAQYRSLTETDQVTDAERQAYLAVVRAMNIYDFIRHKTLFDQIVDHSSKEPDNGICDAILVIPCSNATSAMLQRIHGRKAQDDFVRASMLIHSKPEKQEVASPVRQSRTSSLHASQLEHKHKQQLDAKSQNMYLVHPGQTNGNLEGNTPPDASGQDLLLPVLLTEYKKSDEPTIAKAMERMKTYLVSAVYFLYALGITEQAVFGLVVNGRLGAVTMAWWKNEKVYIMEYNVRSYDITDPLQAFQFVSVLLRLAQHGQELRARFELKKDTVYASLVKSRWSKVAQIEDEKLRDGTKEA